MMQRPPFFFAEPPRDVPLSVRCKLLLGGFANQFGWAFLGFGLIFVWVFMPVEDWNWVFRAGSDLDTAQGRITQVTKTSFSVGGSKGRKGTPVYEYRYEFAVDGAGLVGNCYTTGRKFSENVSVTVEFSKARPSMSRIKGARLSPFGLFASLVLIIPLVGAGFLISGIRKGLKAIRLLAGGRVALGTLKSKEPTGAKINNQPVYKLTFEFVADDRQTYRATAKTHKPRALEDEAQEQLVYDPVDPSGAVLVDSLPGSPRVNEMGVIQPVGLFSTAALFLLPMLTICGHAGYWWWKLSL